MLRTPTSSATRAGGGTSPAVVRRQMPYVYHLRDQLRHELIRCTEQRHPFPASAQTMLDRLEDLICAQERIVAFRCHALAAARFTQP